jgi:GAF domain-containing protein
MSPRKAFLRSHTTFLAEASQVLSRSLDYATTLSEVARLYVPLISDFCFIDMLDENGPCRLTVAHVDPHKRDLVLREANFLYDWEQREGVAAVLRGGPAIFIEDASVTALPSLESSAAAALLQELGTPLSLIILPLRTRGRIIGAVTLTTLESGRHFGREDFTLAQDVATRAAGAIENALLYSAAEASRSELEQARREADRAAQRASFLATVTKVLNASLDQQLIFSNLVHMLVPGWADLCYA